MDGMEMCESQSIQKEKNLLFVVVDFKKKKKNEKNWKKKKNLCDIELYRSVVYVLYFGCQGIPLHWTTLRWIEQQVFIFIEN